MQWHHKVDSSNEAIKSTYIVKTGKIGDCTKMIGVGMGAKSHISRYLKKWDPP